MIDWLIAVFVESGINTYLKKHLGITWRFCCFVMFPSLKLVGPPFALFRLWRKNNACPRVIVLVHLKTVYFPRRWTCKLVFASFLFFMCWSREQLPEVLSKLPVREVRGYLWTLSLSTNTGPCSCFLWRLCSFGSSTLVHMFRKAREEVSFL